MADKKKGRIKINRDICKGCYLCISVCPNNVIKVSERLNQQGYYPAEVMEGKNCTGCALCATMCPDVAIEVYRD